MPDSVVIRVCELLLVPLYGKEKGKSLLRMRSEMPSRSSNMSGTKVMNEGDDQIAVPGLGMN